MKGFAGSLVAGAITLNCFGCNSDYKSSDSIGDSFFSVVGKMPEHVTYEQNPRRIDPSFFLERVIVPDRLSPHFETEWKDVGKIARGAARDAAQESAKGLVDLSFYESGWFDNFKDGESSGLDYFSFDGSLTGIDLSLKAPLEDFLADVFPDRRIDLIGKGEYDFGESFEYKAGIRFRKPEETWLFYVEDENERDKEKDNGTIFGLAISRPWFYPR